MPLSSYDEICSTLTQLIPKLEKILLPDLDPELLEDAWQEYFGDNDPDTKFKLDDPLTEGFFPWFYFNFRDDFNENKTLIDVYRENAKFISHDELKLIDAFENSIPGIWSVTDREPGKGLGLVNVLTGFKISIHERTASQRDLKDLYFFARVATINGISFFHSCCPVPLERELFDDLEEFIEEWKTLEDLNFQNYLIHEYFFAKYFERFAPPMLVNSEGHEIVLLRATYEIFDLKKGIDQLCRLNHLLSKEEQLKEATYYKSGDVRKVTLDWLDPRSKKKAKVLGFLKLDTSKLTLEVNSEERFLRFEKWLKKNLKGGHKLISIEEIETSEFQSNDSDLLPEQKQEIMRNYLYEYYDQWVKEKIPALNNKRPVDLVKTEAGRQQVSALIKEMEKKPSFPGEPEDIFLRLRQKLGLCE